MFRFIIILSFLSLGACDLLSYKIENQHNGSVTVTSGSKKISISSGDCIELIDIFGLGDFPISFSTHGEVLGEAEYGAGNYRVSQAGSVTEVSDEKACIVNSGEAGFKIDSEKSNNKPADSYKPPTDSYKPPADPYKPPTDSYKPPADPYKPPTDSYKPPADPYKPPTDSHKPPADSYKPPADPYKPPTDSHKPPADSYKPPTDSYKPNVAPELNDAGFETGRKN